MKCINCNIDVSPNFVTAIVENKCPGCGGQLLDGASYKKLMALRKQLVPLGLGLDDATLTKVAAAITSKFELWPRENTEPVSATEIIAEPQVQMPQPPLAPKPNVQPKAPKPIQPKSQQEAEEFVKTRMPGVEFEDDLPLSMGEGSYENISPQETASLIEEFGLEKGQASAVAAMDPNDGGNPLLNAMLADMPLTGDEPVSGFSNNRLNRAKALQGTPNMSNIKPMTGRRK